MPRFSRISWKSRDDAEPPRIGARDSRRAEADVVLLRVLLGEAEARRWRLHEGSPNARASGRRPLLALRALEHAQELVVLDVPRRGDDDVAARVHLPVVA